MTTPPPVTSLPSPEWMQSLEIKRLFACFGEGAPLYFVGGCVRDLIIDRDVGDLDLATAFSPDETRAQLEASGIKTLLTGYDHGTVTAVMGKKTFEITSFRKDIETDGRHAVVSYTSDMSEDAQRRDFTVNALYLGVDGALYDPTGDGLADIKGRSLRFIGNAEARLKEDYLRAYRYFRFCSQLGWGVDPSLLPLLKAYKAAYQKLSSERKITELTKIFACENPAEILMRMEQAGLIALTAKSCQNERLKRFFDKQIRYKSYPFYSRYFACFCEGDADVFGLSSVLSRSQRSDIQKLASAEVFLGQNSSSSPREMLYLFGREIALQAALWNDKNEEFVEAILSEEVPVFPLQGSDLIRQGFQEGPALGAAIKKAEKAWIASGFQLSVEECLMRACRV